MTVGATDSNDCNRGADAAPAASGVAATTTAKPRHSILVVEDHDDTARAISKLLLKEGHDVRVEGTIAGAIAYCQQPGRRVDLLIADITLPDGNGWELMRRLSEICRPLVGIAFSGHGMPNDLERSKLSGFCEHLTKPVLFQDLLAAIRRVMSNPPKSAAGPAAVAKRVPPQALTESGMFPGQV